MNVVLDPAFLEKLKKVNVRIRKNVKERLLLFSEDPHNLLLDNHELREKYIGYRSIDITVDYRALYKERQIGEELVAYFITLGTHDQLYGKES